jgi:beta-glucosidase/6-phospho-beta-glucosidase/beta-galactosidase
MSVPIENNNDHDFFYDQFPSSFMWGSTSSATQIEGAWKIDGRSMSWWDTSASRKKSVIPDQSKPDNAADSYHRFTEDVMLLKEMNATTYKFSLSWSRLLPDGTTKKVNKAGVEYYQNLINALLANNIEPIIVLYHFDFAQELFEQQPYNWMDEGVIKAFGAYARFCFKHFGDRVKRFVPIHDPWKHSECGFASGGIRPPSNVVMKGCKNYGSPLKVFKNLLKAHTLAYRIYNKEFRIKQGGSIGLSVNSKCISPSDRNCLKNEIAVPDFASCTEVCVHVLIYRI